ncbi:MAG: hypothetical protein JWP59_4522 [Massilia sp.]|jgi:hypothetical protein|nr:hypothetical protein [Massilia sp.]
MRAAIPDDVRRFVLLAIPSVPYLEALLLMRGAGPVAFDAAALAAGLYLDEGAAGDLMAQLRAAGVTAPAPGAAGRVRYAPAAPLAAMIDRLANVYADNLVGVSMLIHSTNGKQARADAFRLRDE